MVQCESFSKYHLILFNVLLLVCGIALLSFSIIYFSNPTYLINATIHLSINETQIFQSNNLPQIYTLCFFAIGPAIILISLVGCLGSFLHQPCLLVTYTIGIIFTLLLEITSGYILIFYQKEADESIRNWLLNSIKYEYRGASENVISKIWDHVFSHFYCCGVNNPSDFENSLFYNETKSKIPNSCCYHLNMKNSTIAESKCPLIVTVDNSYQKGCFEAIIEFFVMYRNAIGGVLIVIFTIEIITIVAAIVLVKSNMSTRGKIT
ncbi:tetraspanin-18B-like [Arctopsyche grandis]|uniref:tetraspanin-18B-like n=1 Tax=Arctopsyche grandis TaxID=121162 RepID=UPI00406DA1B0